ncbi:MAG: flavodoxin family protein [Candidatus Nanoarchaeia archaeon]|nr:flavodoxin family protein [Candidatus Nanoarchaeia archaeon]MDD5239803.1 flavodoxin family protein [Candidatus Nanoarchaeia archaeon]
MKKVILLSGSPRPEGNTILILRKCAEVLKKFNIETEIISLANKKILGCSACYQCEKYHKCVLNDDVNSIIDKIDKAQGLIVGSPVYFHAARGDLLNLLQRIGMVHLSDNLFLHGKVGGPIVVSRNSGLEHALEDIMAFFNICNIQVPPSAVNNKVIGRNPGEALLDKKGMKCIEKFSADVAELLNSKKK